MPTCICKQEASFLVFQLTLEVLYVNSIYIYGFWIN